MGYEEGGQLTEKVRRKPYSVVLFDEVEKAHEDVFNIMLQLLEDGHITDSQGRRVSFKNTVIVMTSNVGAKNIVSSSLPLGFSGRENAGVKDSDEIKALVMGELKRSFRPEFLTRIDEIIVFHQLSREHIEQIAGNMLMAVQERISQLGIELVFEPEVYRVLAERGFDPVYGARPLRRAIQTAIEDACAEKLLSGELLPGDRAIARAEKGKITIEKKGAVA